MNRLRSFPVIAPSHPCAAAGARCSAADQLRDAQAELKTQGFYYGELNGQNTSETVAAIRRLPDSQRPRSHRHA